MYDQDTLNKIKAVFNKEIGLTLFQKEDFNLIAMNSGSDSPYKLARGLTGFSIGVSFEHVGPAVEIYLTDHLLGKPKSKAIINTFQTYADERNIKIIKDKVNKFNLFLMPIDKFDSISAVCLIIQDLCLLFDGDTRA
ncbi:hypothetical protein [Moritella dasanensis]|uniref:hypothetical protein n=1 Tax=Moritella dasanensis TaxID=428031 RepID=UPI0003673B1F|nr:hypothetical protein [Moritella dasanensis]